MAKKYENSVDDSDFGYWREEWGNHSFPCGDPAVVTIVIICEHGADEIPLCAEHAPEVDA